ncbi:MAG: FAD-binding protein [Hyphomicrobiaceae bacterium]|nr:FAD-binding protein [Hyphomicrobiaceae bacterium]
MQSPTLLRPATEWELQRSLIEATKAGTPVEVVGAGTKRAIGRPTDAGLVMTTTSLTGVRLYEPSELVMAARAGTPLTRIEADLASRNQMLAFEPIDLSLLAGQEPGQGTIGALFAMNLSGARRFAVGAARDHLLGVTAISGEGVAFRSGGRVMKNVTGLDLARMLAGSWGTLAVLTEVTFKVMPRPEETATLFLLGLDDGIAVEALSAAAASPFETTGAVHLQKALAARLWHQGLRSEHRAITAVRIENFSASVAHRIGRLKDELKLFGDVHVLDNDSSLAFWDELRQLSVLQGSTAPLWRISTSPQAGPKVMAGIAGFMTCNAYYDWGGGLIWAEVLPTSDAGAADIRRVIASHGGHATLIRAEPAVRATIDVFQPLEPGLARLSAKLKRTFDPAGILNRGRMQAAF